MPQLLLELFSEEIPARMQAQGARDLERLVADRLKAADLGFETIQAFAGPRRLTLVIEGLPAAQADRVEERKGPRATAPDQAIDGFLRATGLTRDQLEDRDGVLFARIAKTGRPTSEILAEIVDQTVRAFPWPKSMTWGSGTLRWVRPLKRILCLFDGAVVPFVVDGIVSGDVTEGHRFMGPGAPFSVTSFEDYREKLDRAFVVLDADDRKGRIQTLIGELTAARGLEVVPDEGLLDEVAGLAEWPVPVLGDMEPIFLDLPPEVIRTSMRTHQKYFAVRDPKTGKLAAHFIAIANIEASDGGAAMTRGYGRVLSARLNDARFFWTEDRKVPLESRLEKLKGVTFHAKLGTMYERVERITALARELAPLVGADPKLAEIAARLAKADLGTGMVGEFPELQGIMGGYYARLEPGFGLDLDDQGIPEDGSEDPLSSIAELALVPDGDRAGGAFTGANAVPSKGLPPPASSSPGLSGGPRGHPQTLGGPPLGRPDEPGDDAERVGETSPNAQESAPSDAWFDGLSAAEIDQVADAVRDHYKPQGPNDTVPSAPVTVAVALADKLDTLAGFFAIKERPTGSRDPYGLRRAALGTIRTVLDGRLRVPIADALGVALQADSSDLDGINHAAAEVELLLFFADRLKVLLRDEGKRHDLVDAVFALGDDDLVRIVARVEALGAFLATEDGANLLAGYRRAVNILKAEAKKNPGESYDGAPESGLFREAEERALAEALQATLPDMTTRLETEDFTGAMTALAALRGPVDAFFEAVLVNAPESAVRLNRLRLLSQMRDAANRVADFSLIAG
jgi:glycyl-tRNA synthetase beta chain